MPKDPPKWARGHDTGLEYHRGLLDDPHRMAAYEKAIRALVRPGDRVLDLGAGTGILSMLAARRGAARVYAVESMAVAGFARQLVEANQLSDRVQILHGDILELEPPETPVDLVISDFMGRFVVDDGMFPAVRAAQRWMHEHTRFCPASLEMKVAPVGDFHFHAVDFFDDPVYGLDLSLARRYTLNYGYYAGLRPAALMATEQNLDVLRPPALPTRIDHTLRFELQRGGRLQGLAGWFEAELAPDVTLSTRPGIGTHWGQYLFPLPPTEVRPGDVVDVRLWIEEDTHLVWHWEGSVGATHFASSTQQALGERT